jgi:hypothetical protein
VLRRRQTNRLEIHDDRTVRIDPPHYVSVDEVGYREWCGLNGSEIGGVVVARAFDDLPLVEYGVSFLDADDRAVREEGCCR